MIAAIICGSYALAAYSSLFGVLNAPPADRRDLWLLILTIAVPCLVHSAIFAHSRYHLPTMPLVLLFSAACFTNWRSVWQQRAQWRFRLAAIGCLLLTLSWVREIVFVDFAHASQILP